MKCIKHEFDEVIMEDYRKQAANGKSVVMIVRIITPILFVVIQPVIVAFTVR